MVSDPFFLAQSLKITSWLSPVWIMSVGLTAGLLLVALVFLKMRVFQSLSGLNTVADKPSTWILAGAITSIVYLTLFLGFFYWLWGGEFQWTANVGLLLGFLIPISLLLGFGGWVLVSRKLSGEFHDLVFDGFLKWFNRLLVTMATFFVLGLGLHFVNGFGMITFFDEPVDFLKSVARIPVLGEFEKNFSIPPSAVDSVGDKIELEFDGSELQVLEIRTNRRIEVAAIDIAPDIPYGKSFVIEPNDDEPFMYRQRRDGSGVIPLDTIEHLYVKNFGRDNANIQVTYLLEPVYREAMFVPLIALCVVSFYLGYLILSALCPKIMAIALSTFKTELGQPLFWVVFGVVVTFILITIFIPYNTFGEDIKMYTDSGLSLIRVAAIFLAVWAASKSVAEEIEGRTALTVLSKPVGRRQFVIGKFVGISMAIALMFCMTGLWFYIWVAFKPVYDFQEASKGLAEWTVCFQEAVNVLPGLFLCFLEVVIFVAISIAISTRMGILANFLICFAIYVVGHITPLIVQSSLGAFETVAVFGQLVAIVFPVLDHFDIQAAINTGTMVPLPYLGWSIVYTAVYGTMVMLLALVLFEDRDLA